jgi:hypothetical protein
VSNRATLLVLKLKAIWDRKYRIDHGTSHDPEWEKGKLIKDHADILALIDPEYGGEEIEIFILGELLGRYSFLEESLLSVCDSTAGIEKYGRMTQQDAQNTIEKIISLVR